MLEKLMGLKLFDRKNKDVIIYLAGVIFLIILIVYIYFPKKEAEVPVFIEKDKIEVIKESDDGKSILYEDKDGQKVIETIDPNIDEESARKILDASDSNTVEFYQPAAGGPRPLTEEDIDNNLSKEWGIDPDYSE